MNTEQLEVIRKSYVYLLKVINNNSDLLEVENALSLINDLEIAFNFLEEPDESMDSFINANWNNSEH